MLPHAINHLTEYISKFVSPGPHNVLLCSLYNRFVSIKGGSHFKCVGRVSSTGTNGIRNQAIETVSGWLHGFLFGF